MTYEDYLLTTQNQTRIRATRIMKRLVKRFQKHVFKRSTVDAPYILDNPRAVTSRTLSLFQKLLFDDPNFNPFCASIIITREHSYIWHNLVGEDVNQRLSAIFSWALEKTK